MPGTCPARCPPARTPGSPDPPHGARFRRGSPAFVFCADGTLRHWRTQDDRPRRQQDGNIGRAVPTVDGLDDAPRGGRREGEVEALARSSPFSMRPAPLGAGGRHRSRALALRGAVGAEAPKLRTTGRRRGSGGRRARRRCPGPRRSRLATGARSRLASTWPAPGSPSRRSWPSMRGLDVVAIWRAGGGGAEPRAVGVEVALVRLAFVNARRVAVRRVDVLGVEASPVRRQGNLRAQRRRAPRRDGFGARCSRRRVRALARAPR